MSGKETFDPSRDAAIVWTKENYTPGMWVGSVGVPDFDGANDKLVAGLDLSKDGASWTMFTLFVKNGKPWHRSPPLRFR